MAFTLANWTCVSASLSQGQLSVTPFGELTPTLINAPNLFTYNSPNDTVAQIGAADYFLPIWFNLKVNDIVLGGGTDASFALVITAVSETSVTTGSMGLTTGVVGTTDIINNAVTYAKMQQAAASRLLGNPTGAPANISEISLGSGLSFSGTALNVASTSLQYASVAISSAEFLGMFAAPKLLVAAPGANNLIVVDQMVLGLTFNTVAYAAGGIVAAQYDLTANGLGVLASSGEAAADFYAAASSSFRSNGDTSVAPFLTSVNKGLYLSNKTAAFTLGNSALKAHVWYRIVSVV